MEVNVTVDPDGTIYVNVSDDANYTPEVVGDWLTRAVSAAITTRYNLPRAANDEGTGDDTPAA